MKKLDILKVGVLVLISGTVYAVPATGTFIAETTCQAYISKNNKTNPDNIYLKVGKSYPIKEKNKDANPDWFRVYVEDVTNENRLRWVNKDCGEAKIEDDKPGKQCIQKAGYADSYVLALSWQPAFCETYGFNKGKQECENLPPESHQAKSFSLHGFWPNQAACGTNYGFCDTKKESNFCSYPALNLSFKTSELLHSVMPGYNESSCLQRHEWYKHGTCQLRSKDEYYTQAATFVNQINNSELEELFKDNIGKNITIEEFNNVFNQSFGPDASDKVYLNCSDGMLVDVYISLPKNADDAGQTDLKALLKNSPDAKASKCPDSFKISDFSHANEIIF